MKSAMQISDVSKIRLGSNARRNALLAFNLEPTAFDSIRAMAIIKQNEKAPIAARNLMRSLAVLTKRDPLANYWLIYDYGQLGDIGKVLSYYDMTMRASVGSAEVLMPVMVRALESESSIVPFSSILERRPPWEGRFWTMASRSGEALDNALNLRMKLLDNGISYPLAVDLELVNQLVQYQKYVAASSLYLALNKKKAAATNRIVNDPDFAKPPTLPPFDWALFGTGEYGAFISPSSQSMSISATANAGGIVAQQLINLPPSTYLLTVETDYDQSDGPLPISVRVFCAKYGERGRNNPIFRSGNQKIGGIFKMNSSVCRFYWLEVLALPTDDIDGYDVTVSKIDVQRIKPSKPSATAEISQ